MIRKIALVGSGALLAAIGLAGCQAHVPAAPSGNASAPSTSASPTYAVQTSPSGSSPSGGSTVAECKLAQLSVTVGGGDAGMSHRSAALVFRNTGTVTCRMRGYPGVAALDAQGTQVGQAARTTRGYLGGPQGTAIPTVDIAPGKSASALVEGIAKGVTDSCKPYAGMLVTPPDETHSVKLSQAAGGDCADSMQIHPVVPGDTGQQS